ncbi:MAG TPA: Holliday junction resolvase RuvX [Gallionella sp.]|nr:Holliday junction resolvase RuvX [Gallionella sp.]
MPDTRGRKSEDRRKNELCNSNTMPSVSAMSDKTTGHSTRHANNARQAAGHVLSPLKGTILAFDFGTKRIGVASGNTLLRQANPLTTITDEKTVVRFAKIEELLDEWQPCALVVGLPSYDDGTPHELTALCRRFANRLKGRFNLPTILVDERYTSHTASVQLSEQGVHGMKQKLLIDQYAAQQILQAYFDEPAAGMSV